MARVNVEEAAFGDSRLARFERLMAWDRRTAIGCLVMLWHDSQGLLRIDGSEKDIAEWCWALNADEGKRLVAALETVGYLTLLDNGKYLIHGNETQIENLVTNTTRAKKGGEATRAKWAAVKAAREGLKPAPSLLQAGPEPTPSVPRAGSGQAPARPNAMQGNAEQKNSPNGECGQLRRPRAPYSDFLSLWNQNRGTLAGVEDLTDSRKAKIRARWAEKPDLAYWEGAVKRLASSTFASGGKWATFDWLMKNDTNHTKAAAGNYDNADSGGTSDWMDDPEQWAKITGSHP